jgi:nitrate ABC transporter ATP-binding subunit
MALEIRNVWKAFVHKRRVQEVLRNVDLTIERGEFVSLIGHSGCGKSTLLNVLGGLVAPDSGAVSLDGERIVRPGPDRAMVFQQYSLLPRASLHDNVRIAARSARPDRSRDATEELVERYLAAVGLWEHRGKRPHEVSGGMQQRCAVARAFAVEPRVLLLDEPFGALDALTRARLQVQLIELWQNESATETVVMVTHGIDEAILLSDRIVVMSTPPHPSIIDIIPVDLPRPRDRVSVIDDPHFRLAQQRLLALLELERDAAVA